MIGVGRLDGAKESNETACFDGLALILLVGMVENILGENERVFFDGLALIEGL